MCVRGREEDERIEALEDGLFLFDGEAQIELDEVVGGFRTP